MDNYNFDQMPLDELICLFNSDIWFDNDAYLDNVADAIAQFGDAGVEYLLGILNTNDEIRQRAAFFGITRNRSMPKDDIIKLLLSYLSHKRLSMVICSIDGLIYVKEFSHWEKIKNLLNHSSEYVRGAVLRYARHALKKEEAFSILITGLDDSHYIVIENAIDELDELGESEAIPYIERFLEHPHPYVKQAAKTAIDNLKDLKAEDHST